MRRALVEVARELERAVVLLARRLERQRQQLARRRARVSEQLLGLDRRAGRRLGAEHQLEAQRRALLVDVELEWPLELRRVVHAQQHVLGPRRLDQVGLELLFLGARGGQAHHPRAPRAGYRVAQRDEELQRRRVLRMRRSPRVEVLDGFGLAVLLGGASGGAGLVLVLSRLRWLLVVVRVLLPTRAHRVDDAEE